MGQRFQVLYLFDRVVNAAYILRSLAILKDWIDLIDDDGWVAREQILGEEARSKVRALNPASMGYILSVT
jgi:hypothetical protein